MKQNQRFNPFNNIVGPTLAPHAPTLNSNLLRKFSDAFISFAGIPALPKKRKRAPVKNPRYELFKDRLHAIFLGPKKQFGMLDYATGLLDQGLLLSRGLLSSAMDGIRGLSFGAKVALLLPVTLPIQLLRLALTASQIVLRAATYVASFAIVAATSLVTLAVHGVSSLVKNALLKNAGKLNVVVAATEFDPAMNTDLETHLQNKGQTLKSGAPLNVTLDAPKDTDNESTYRFIISQPEFQSRAVDYNDIKKPAKNDVDAKAVAALVALDYQEIAKDMDSNLRAPRL